MRRQIRNRFFLRLRWGLIVMLFLTIKSFAASSSLDVAVKVSKEVSGQNYIYHYRIINSTPYPIAQVTIGFDSKTFATMLLVPPVGFERATESTKEHIIPASSSSSPAGWELKSCTQEESNKISIEWETSNDNQAFAVAPGSVLDGFSITVPKEDNSYLNTKAEVYFTRGSSSITVPIVMDVVGDPAPDLKVMLSPNVIWPPNNKLVEINSSITASQNSTIKLVSITCNDGCVPSKDIADAMYGTDDRKFSIRATRSSNSKSGRDYLVTYSATNSRGKTTMRSEKINVPHSKKK